MHAHSIIVAQFGMLLKQLSWFRIANEEFFLIKKVGHLISNKDSSTGCNVSDKLLLG